IEILKEEYRCLYDLAVVRVGALDHRALVATGALLTFLGSFAAGGAEGRLALLLGVALGIVWFVRPRRTHARAFEDAIRRIDAIERSVNDLAGRKLMLFQSSHPSRGKTVGGRTGTETMMAAVVTSLVLLAACGLLAWDHPFAPRSPEVLLAYFA